MLDDLLYYYHNPEDASLYFHIKAPGHWWQGDEYKLNIWLESPTAATDDGYTFYKMDDYTEQVTEISKCLEWDCGYVDPGAVVKYALYYDYHQECPDLDYELGRRQGRPPSRHTVSKSNRQITLSWHFHHSRWSGKSGSRTWHVYPKEVDIMARLISKPFTFPKEE